MDLHSSWEKQTNIARKWHRVSAGDKQHGKQSKERLSSMQEEDREGFIGGNSSNLKIHIFDLRSDTKWENQKVIKKHLPY